MKTSKSLLALAVMMVVLMPSCTKKEDITVNSQNPYIAMFATCGYLLSKDADDAVAYLDQNGWTTDADDSYQKTVGGLNYTIEVMVSDETGKIGQVEGRLDSETGKTDLFSEKNYSNFIVSLDKAYQMNGNDCGFQSAKYQQDGVETTFDNFKKLKSKLKYFVAADATLAYWGTREPCAFNIHTRYECKTFVFTCTLTDTRQKISVDDHSDD